MVHAHRGAGTKFFFHERTTGANFIQRFMAGATPTTADGPGETDEEGIGLYLGAIPAPLRQIGVSAEKPF